MSLYVNILVICTKCKKSETISLQEVKKKIDINSLDPLSYKLLMKGHILRIICEECKCQS